MIAVVTSLLLLAAPPALHCPAGFEPLGADACLVVPKPVVRPERFVVYLHGMLPLGTDFSTTPELKAMGLEAKRRGYVLLAVRGEAGLCYWGKEVKDYFCWPSDRSMATESVRTLKRLNEAIERAKDRVHSGLSMPFVAGFSNGGFFLSMIATDYSFDARGYAVLHAGGVTGQTFTADRALPTLLCGAKGDPIQLPTMKLLEQQMLEAGWKPVFSLRAGSHEVVPADAKAVFDFFDSQQPE
jgi:predicted esterase